jgi:hypothetical protein
MAFWPTKPTRGLTDLTSLGAHKGLAGFGLVWRWSSHPSAWRGLIKASAHGCLAHSMWHPATCASPWWRHRACEPRLVLRCADGAKNVQIGRYGGWLMVAGTKSTLALSLLYKSDCVLRDFIPLFLGTEDGRQPLRWLATVMEEPMLESIGTGKTTISIAYKKRSPLQNPLCFLFDFPLVSACAGSCLR